LTPEPWRFGNFGAGYTEAIRETLVFTTQFGIPKVANLGSAGQGWKQHFPCLNPGGAQGTGEKEPPVATVFTLNQGFWEPTLAKFTGDTAFLLARG